MRLSRRKLLVGGATISFADWFGSQALAGPTAVRKNLATAGGQTDLAKYAHGVKLMMARAEADPSGWMFEWYIHAVRSDRTKASELARVYPSASPRKTLAQQSWSTCQAHGPGTVEDYFLPWHRMYVLYLEATIRTLINDPGFALPYWHYTDPAQRVLPSQFRQSGSAQWGMLYRPNRNALANGGQPIDQGISPTPLNTASLAETTYRPSGAHSGFCSDLDGGLHGSLHVLVGNGLGMGSVPWAANDPIFWMHHCNIDRMWASWNAHGGCNPADAWLKQTFVFPDGHGNRVVTSVDQVKAIAPLHYSYDRLEPGKKIGACPRPGLVSLLAVPHLAVMAKPLALNPAGPVEVTLTAPPPELAGVAPGAAKAPAGGRQFLVIEGLQAAAQPGVLFDVAVRGADGKPRDIGTINFFDAVPAPHEGGMNMPMADPSARAKFFSFDVTDALKGAKGLPSVTLRAVGRGEVQSKPVVGGIRLVRG